MTISSQVLKSGPYNCNGVTTQFAYGFKILDVTHLRVVRTSAAGVETDLVYPADYSVSGVGNDAGGVVTTTAVYADGKITPLRGMTFLQLLHLVNQAAFYPNDVERALDLLTMMTQQLLEASMRSVKVGAGAASAEVLLPSAADRANKIFAFDAFGAVTMASGSGGVTDWNSLVGTIPQAKIAASTILQAHLAFLTQLKSVPLYETISTTPFVMSGAGDGQLRLLAGSAAAVTLPNPVSFVDTCYFFKNTLGSDVVLTTPSGTINGSATYTLRAGATAVLCTNSGGYRVILSTNSIVGSLLTIDAQGNLDIPTATSAEYRAGIAQKFLTVAAAWGGALYTALTDAATVAVDMNAGINFDLNTIGGNRVLGNPTNPKVGQRGVIRVVQDGTGGRTLSYGSNYKFAQATAPLLSTAAGAVDLLYYDVITTTFIALSLMKGVA